MSDEFSFEDFIGSDEGEALDLPVAASFPKNGLISCWRHRQYHRVGTRARALEMFPELLFTEGYEQSVIINEVTGSRDFSTALAKHRRPGFEFESFSTATWYEYYYTDSALAQVLVDAVGDARTTFQKRYWIFQTGTEQVLNFADRKKALEGFGPHIVRKVPVTSLSARAADRHVFQQIALPSAVQAMALLAGYVSEPIFHVKELEDDNRDYDLEFFQYLCGDREVPYTESETWKRRTALWKALGEDNAKAYALGGKPGDETHVQSEKLRNCLQLVASIKWATEGAWLRLVGVYDPEPSATWEGQNGPVRRNIDIVTEVFPNQATAQAAAEKELAAKVGGDGQGAPVSTSAGPAGVAAPAIPAQWAGQEVLWRQQVALIKAHYGGAAEVSPVVRAQIMNDAAFLSQEHAATPDDVIAWWSHV